MDEIFRRYATIQRAVGYFVSVLMVVLAFVAVEQSLLVGFLLAGAGVGTFYATRWLYERMRTDR